MAYIHNISYYDNGRNLKERKALTEQGHRLEDEMNIMLEKLNEKYPSTPEHPSTDEEEAEYDKEYNKIHEKYSNKYMALYRKCFILEFPEVKNDWFVNTFCASFKTGKTHISSKQADIFEKYTVDNDFTWKTNEKYCIVGKRFITFNRKSNYVTFEDIPD